VIDKTCPICGATFSVQLCNKRRKTCSYKCGRIKAAKLSDPDEHRAELERMHGIYFLNPYEQQAAIVYREILERALEKNAVAIDMAR